MRQGSRVSCLAQTGFAAFGKGVQLISGSPYAQTEQIFLINLAKRYTCHLMMISNSLELGGCGEDVAYSKADCECVNVNVNKSFISQKKITKFSAQKFLQGKNKNRTRVGHIKELLGLLSFRRLGSY